MNKKMTISTVIFFGIILFYIILSLLQTEKHFTYFIDDAYIHLAIAKNFSQYGVWGMTHYLDSSSTSSPFFTFFLSFCIFIFGNTSLLSLILNGVFALGTIYFLTKYFSQYFSSTNGVVCCVLFTLFNSVLYLAVLSGMEHVLQVFVFVVNGYFFQKWNASDYRSQYSGYFFYFSLSFLGLIRFESMFYFFSLALLFLLVKRYKDFLKVFFFGFVPVFIFCYFNHAAFGYYFPNSLIVKGNQFSFSNPILPQISHFTLDAIIFNRSFYKIAFFPLLISGVLLYKEYKKKGFYPTLENNFLLVGICITTILHCIFADIKNIFRYEAYFLVIFSMLLLPKLRFLFQKDKIQNFKNDLVLKWSVVALAVFMVYKMGIAHKMVVLGSKNIYEQQIQSAKFLHHYYNTSKVVANDIGAICYYSNIHLFDIVGLGTLEALPFTKNNTKPTAQYGQFIENYTQKNHFDLAIVYDEWFNGFIPKKWKKVAILKIRNRYNVPYNNVSIYSIDLRNRKQLAQNIKNFNWNKNVEVVLLIKE